MEQTTHKQYAWKFIVLAGVFLVVLFGSALLGRFNLTPHQLFSLLRSQFQAVEPCWPVGSENVLFEIRLPRIAAAALVGASLALAGVAYQGMFRNPMVSPDLLGVSAGAGFGAALVMLLGGSWWQIQSSAFLFGVAAVAAAWCIGRIFGGQNITVLVLACPGALVIGAPIANVAGIGRGAREGILLKGGDSTHTFAKTDAIVFDKTGTLTAGVPTVAAQRAYTDRPEEALALAAGAERASAHPLAKAVVRAAAALPAYGPEEAQTVRGCIRRRPFTGR